MILVTGAAGKTGQAVIRALTKKGAPVRALTHRDRYRPLLEAAGAGEIVVGDLQKPADLRLAMQGVRAVYHICPNMHPAEEAIGRAVIAAAQTAGVALFGFHSVLHPQTETMPHHWHKLRVEARLFEAGLPFTILQPTAYMQNILGGWQSIIDEGVYRVPYAVDTRLSLVDLADVAEAAAIVLTEPGHQYAIYELAGPAAPSQTEIAALLSELLGRPVRAAQTPLDDWQRGAEDAGLGSYQIETLVRMFRYYEQHQFLGNSNVLRWLLGREPSSLRAFLQRQG